MQRRIITIKAMAEKLDMSVNEVKQLCEENKIPYQTRDEGTVWEQKVFDWKEVLKAVGPRKKKEDPFVEETEKEKPAKKK